MLTSRSNYRFNRALLFLQQLVRPPRPPTAHTYIYIKKVGRWVGAVGKKVFQVVYVVLQGKTAQTLLFYAVTKRHNQHLHPLPGPTLTQIIIDRSKQTMALCSGLKHCPHIKIEYTRCHTNLYININLMHLYLLYYSVLVSHSNKVH